MKTAYQQFNSSLMPSRGSMNCPKCGTLTVKLGVVQCATGDAEKRGCPRCRGIWFQQLMADTSGDGARGVSGGAPDTAREARALPCKNFGRGLRLAVSQQ